MARQIILADDLDNSITENVQTLTFALDGKQYEIDLGEENAAKLRDALAPFIEKARRAGGGSSTASTTRRGGSAVPSKEIRAWAKEQGKEVSSLIKSDRGAVPRAVIEAYNKAHGTNY
ncbi:Lsr2 family protein [Microbacterium sp. CIAB417]|uniref:histone-like nucleoid-structuring protein Lsr2 n=1 Tax=Microbacterium sp. CIAB417 TaxID=2860287 RepID=UPI001FAE5E3F|nr:Lsr2 family protein [Microbacterium sp. CIAB417]